MKTSLLILAMLTLTYTAHARLGETPAQINARYGAMLNTPTIIGTNLWSGHFRHAGFEIDVTFWKGKCVEEYLQMDDLFTEDSAKAMFSSITGDGKVTTDWLPIRDDNCSMINFENLTSGASGRYYSRVGNGGSLTVQDKSYRDFEAKELTGENKKKLAGF